MTDSENSRADIKVPSILSLRDVFLMLTAVVSVMVAWGMYGTRLSVVEERMVASKQNVIEVRQMVKDLRVDTDHTLNDEYGRIHHKMDQIRDRLRDVETNFIRIDGLLKHHNKK